MKNLKMPCNKCLILPLCRNRYQVECINLYRYLLGRRGFKALSNSFLKEVGGAFRKECNRVTYTSGIRRRGARQAHPSPAEDRFYVDFNNSIMTVFRGKE